MTGRMTTILATFGSVALVLAGSEKETPSYIWNASESVPIVVCIDCNQSTD